MKRKTRTISNSEIDNGELVELIEKQKKSIALAIAFITGNVDLNIDFKIPRNTGIVMSEMFLLVYQLVDDAVNLGKKGGLSTASCIPIIRSVIETCINITYILACGEEQAKKAMNHAIARTIKGFDRESGSGSHSIRVKRLVPDEFVKQFDDEVNEFTSKKGRALNWTQLSVVQRIDEIAKVFGDEIARNLNGVYIGSYSDSSELIHGSFLGCLIAHVREPFTNATIDATETQLKYDKKFTGILTDSFMSTSCALRALKMYLKADGDPFSLEENYSRFVEVVLGDDMPNKQQASPGDLH
nr:DUF5677 domain-containing protein [uncultured Methylophaga sp.]